MKKNITLFFIILFSMTAMAQDLPKIAVYVTGDLPDNNKRVLGSQMLTSLVNSGRYSGMERPGAFFAEAERKRTAEYEGVINDGQISELGKEFGVRYVCIADVVPAFGTFQIEARIVDVETSEIVLYGESRSPLKTVDELTQVLEAVVKIIFGEQPEQTPAAAIAPNEGRIIASTVRHVTPPAAAAAPSQTPAAPAAVWPPKAAVYVTGLNAMLGNALSRAVTSALMKANIYEGIERIDQYITGTPGDRQIIEAGAKAGVHFVFVINVSGQTTVRIIDVDLATEAAKISLDGKVSSPIDAGKMATSIVNFLLKSGPQPPPNYTPEPVPAAVAYRTTSQINQTTQLPKRDYYLGVNKTMWGDGLLIMSSEWATVEGGWIWGNGAFFGYEASAGYIHTRIDKENNNGDKYGNRRGKLTGLGFNLGNTFELSKSCSFVYGLSAGFWFKEADYYLHSHNSSGNCKEEEKYEKFLGFGGPFVKLREKTTGLELTYRGLMGDNRGDYGHIDYNDYYDYYRKKGFRIKNQLKLGWRYESNNRQR